MPNSVEKTGDMSLPGVSQPFWNTQPFGRKGKGVSKIIRTEELERNIARIRKYMYTRNVPPWYRGMSKFQYDAAEELLYALRDDSCQMTTHRTAWCVKRLGVVPMIKSSQIWFLIQLSQQSDLAFIWFLMEIHYKTQRDDHQGEENYSINEQILLSCISHLDMIPTLKGLSSILPPSQPPKHILEKRRQRDELRRQQELEKEKMKKNKKKSSTNLLPYFRKQTYPVPIETDLIGKRRDFKVRLGLYTSWNNPHKKVANESKRWFSQYKLADRKRNLQTNSKALPINKLIEGFKAAKLPVNTVNEMRTQSKEFDILQESLHNQLNAVVKETFSQLTNNPDTLPTTKERIRMQLRRNVEQYLNDFRKKAIQSRRECLSKMLQYSALVSQYENQEQQYKIAENSLFKKDSLSENIDSLNMNDSSVTNVTDKCSGLSQECAFNYNINNFSVGYNKHTSADSGIRSIQIPNSGMTRFTKRQCGGTTHNDKTLNETGSSLNQRTQLSYEGDNFVECENEYFKEEQASDLKQSLQKISFSTNLTKSNEYTNIDKKESENILSKVNSSLLEFTDKHTIQEFLITRESEKFFEITKEAQIPYTFDYRKIFFLKNNTEENILIRQELIKAIDSDVLLMNHLTEKMDPLMAINYYIEKQLNKIPDNYTVKQDVKNVLGYNLNYYDPDDDVLMDGMLYKALKYLAKDPKYVAAGLSAIQHHPVLREFIRVHFGKRYTVKERQTSWKECLHVFYALQLLDLHVSLPWSDKDYPTLKIPLYTDYSKRDYLIKLNQTFQKRFFRNIDTAVLSRARLYWFGMRPLLCKPPIRGPFFAYIPAAPGGFPYFRPYKGTEKTEKTGKKY